MGNKKILTAFCLFYVLVNLLSLRLPFFWGDAIVQSSIAAQWYYDHDFAHFFLPVKDNPGHPPFFGMYLAFWWKILERTLAVSHLAMLPFLIGIAYQFFHIARYFLSPKFLLFALVLFAIEPTILAQATMVTPELPILFLYLLAIRAMLYRQVFWQVIAMCLVVLLNTRGAMIVAVVFLTEVFIFFIEKYDFKQSILSNLKGSTNVYSSRIFLLLKNVFRLSVKYILAGMVAVAWLFVHYYIEGWVGFNRADMPWKNSFIRVEGIGILKNIGVFGWRLLDFGRVFMWFVVALAALRWWRFTPLPPLQRGRCFSQGEKSTAPVYPPLEGAGGWKKNIYTKNLSLLALIITPLLVFAPVMLPYIGTLQHRYLLPFFSMFVIGVAYCFYYLNLRSSEWRVASGEFIHLRGGSPLKHGQKMPVTFDEKHISKKTYGLFLILIIGLLTGHLWVYPDKVSQGWEASLAHLPYFDVRDKMTNYIIEKGINPNDIATGSPNKYRRLDSDLQTDGIWKFVDIDEVRYDTFTYIIYSNVFNDFADSTYHDLHSNWQREQEFKSGQVRMTLFGRWTTDGERRTMDD